MQPSDPGDTPNGDDQALAEAIDDDMLGDEDLVTDGLRAHDLDLVDSVRDRADRENPDFDRIRPRSDHTAQQLVVSRTDRSDLIGTELPAEGDQAPEEAAVHLEDESGGAV